MGGDTLAYYWTLEKKTIRRVPPGGLQSFAKPFWVDAFEVSNIQYGSTGEADLPVVDIRWPEARDFCINRGGRLPTEAEWEYVARGPSASYYPWGD
jgi:formylglycine-generating enzyme required for sulfatase activity